jgi:hypothetical protein
MVLLIRQNLGFGFFDFIQLVTCDLRVTWPSWIPWIRDSLFGPSGSASTPLSFLTYNKTMRLFNMTKKISKIKAQLPDSLVVPGGKKLGITKQSPKYGFAGIY